MSWPNFTVIFGGIGAAASQIFTQGSLNFGLAAVISDFAMRTGITVFQATVAPFTGPLLPALFTGGVQAVYSRNLVAAFPATGVAVGGSTV